MDATTKNPTHEWRAAILNRTDNRPVVLRRRYDDSDPERVAIYAAADMGQLLIDGLADGVWIDAPALDEATVADMELMLLQASRLRFSRTEYIACPSCGRTLYDIQSTLAMIKARTSHLKDLKIGVMGCIVNGPGEMADADYGYVGSSPEHITLYRGREPTRRKYTHLCQGAHLRFRCGMCSDPRRGLFCDRSGHRRRFCQDWRYDLL